MARFVNAGTAGLAHRLGPYMSRILDLGIGVSLGGSLGGLSDCLGTGFDETLPPPFPEDPPEDPLPATLYGSSSLEPDPKGRMIGWLLLFMDTGPDCVLYRGVAENLDDSFVISYVDIYIIPLYQIRIHIQKLCKYRKSLQGRGGSFVRNISIATTLIAIIHIGKFRTFPLFFPSTVEAPKEIALIHWDSSLWRSGNGLFNSRFIFCWNFFISNT